MTEQMKQGFNFTMTLLETETSTWNLPETRISAVKNSWEKTKSTSGHLPWAPWAPWALFLVMILSEIVQSRKGALGKHGGKTKRN